MHANTHMQQSHSFLQGVFVLFTHSHSIDKKVGWQTLLQSKNHLVSLVSDRLSHINKSTMEHLTQASTASLIPQSFNHSLHRCKTSTCKSFNYLPVFERAKDLKG